MTEAPLQLRGWQLPLTTLSGVGEKLSSKIEALIGGNTLRDLILYRPTRWLDRRVVEHIADLQEEQIQTISGIVQNVSPPARGSKLQKVRLADDTGFLTLVFFNPNSGYIKKLYPEGSSVTVSGKIEDFHGQRQMTHPEYSVATEKKHEIPIVEPVYPLTAGLTNRRLHGLILEALEMAEWPEEWLRPSLLKQERWPGVREALLSIHKPEFYDEERFQTALDRLAYDEALARAFAFQKQRHIYASDPAPSIPPQNGLLTRFESALPYALTSAQRRAFEDIGSDMSRTSPMQRMLQGDVGSGKTTVAAYACAIAASHGYQIAIMAPTEVLAKQLFASISDIVAPLDITSACLTGKMKAAEKRELHGAISNGDIQIVCGTHALFQDAVAFSKLGLVIIDEQHRFGVNDRAKLALKGVSPHLLIMSATPIPRSLAMTVHGDVDLSILDEKPAGRQPIETSIVPEARLGDVINAVGRAISKGEQAFWVCPRVDAEDDGASAVSRHAMLADIYDQPVGLVHGRLSSQDKDKALETFRQGESAVLVATTVIEVGVDVPGATIMVIEGAERFGLAQLHQLRGRVGRGSKKSFCLLIYTPPLGATAKQRLETLRGSEDGFYIAEVDFKLRGPGDVLGLAQSGLPDFRFLDLSRHQRLLSMSQKDVALPPEQNSSHSVEALKWLMGPDLTDRPKV